MRLAAIEQALFAPRQTGLRLATAFEDEGEKVSGGTCSPEGDMLWRHKVNGDTWEDDYALCYAPGSRNNNDGPSGALQCDANSYVMIDAPKFCCRNPRITVAGEKLHAKTEVCGDMLADFDPAGQKIRYVQGPASDGNPVLQQKLEDAALGSTLPSPIGTAVLKEGAEWKLLLGQRCQGRDGTLIQWPSGRVEMCPAGTQPVHGSEYMSWQCDGMYQKPLQLHCCTVRGKMKCVPNFIDQSGAAGCHCKGVGGIESTVEDHENNGEEAVKAQMGLSPLPALLLSSGAPAQLSRRSRRGCTRQLGQHFL